VRSVSGLARHDRDLSVATSVDLGRAVRRLRRDRCLSIEALAFAAEMHPTYLSSIERGLRNPTWIKVSDLAWALRVPVSVLALAAEGEALRAVYLAGTL
jgi:transcriptional regulator with XRE-family HTH domain